MPFSGRFRVEAEHKSELGGLEVSA